MNRHVRSFLLASGLALGLPGSAALAQQPDPAAFQQTRSDRMHAGPQRWLRRLDLTQAQRDQVFKIFHDQAPALREHMQAARRAGQALRQLALSSGFDAARARALAEEQAKASAEVAFMRAESMSRVVAILTPEQREKLQQLRSEGRRRGRG